MYSDKKVKTLVKALEQNKVDKLSADDQELLMRINTADDLIRKVGITKARKMLVTKYQVAISTAYALINTAQHIYGTAYHARKDYFKQYSIDKLQAVIQYVTGPIEQYLESQDDPEAKKPDIDGKDLAAVVRALKELRETMGYDKEESDASKWDGIEQHIIVFTGDVRDVGVEPIKNRDEIIAEILKDAKNNIDAEDAEIIE